MKIGQVHCKEFGKYRKNIEKHMQENKTHSPYLKIIAINILLVF